MCARKVLALIAVLSLAALLMALSIVIQTHVTYRPLIASLEHVRPQEAAIILGASVKLDGTPSDALRDRVNTGVRLYKAAKVRKLLMTGDDGAFHTNEVATMKRLAREAGVPEDAIMVDGHGYRTYESCKRAASVFGLKEGIVVTQRFHLYRALSLCSRLGLQNLQGVSADLQPYERIVFFTVRDWAATLKAWWDIHIIAPASPVGG